MYCGLSLEVCAFISGNHARAKFRILHDPAPNPDVSNHVSYAGARPKTKTVTALPPQQQSGYETTSKRHLYHMPLGTPTTHELSPKWMENEEVLHCLRGGVKTPPCI